MEDEREDGQLCLQLVGRLAADAFTGAAVRVAAGDFLEEAHEAHLIDSWLLCTHVLLPEKVLPPLLALLAQVPLLQVVYQSDVVVLAWVDRGGQTGQPAPETLWSRLSLHPHHQEGVVDEVELHKELSINAQLLPKLLGESIIDFQLVLQPAEVQVLEDAANSSAVAVALLQSHAVCSGALHVVGPDDLVARTACVILHEEDVVGLAGLALNAEEAVGLGEESVGVGEEMSVEVLEVLEEEGELVLVDGLEDVAAVGGEEKELPAASALTLHDPIQLVTVLHQFEAAPDLAQLLLRQQPAEHPRREDGKRAGEEGDAGEDVGCLLVVLDEFGADEEADFLVEVEALEVVDAVEVIGGREVLLVGDLDAGEEGDDLGQGGVPG